MLGKVNGWQFSKGGEVGVEASWPGRHHPATEKNKVDLT